MRRLSVFLMSATLSCMLIGGKIYPISASASEVAVYVGGMSAGFTLKTDGAQIIALSEVLTEAGKCAPASEAGFRVGDVIQKVGGIRIGSISELNEVVNKSQGKELTVEALRGGEIITFSLRAVQEKNSSKYKMGVLVRENISGIGTVTYINKETGNFGALGHSVVGENQQILQISSGAVYECSIVGVCKGVRGKAGELRGMFLNDKQFGSAEKLCDCGIFGKVSQEFEVDGLQQAVASSNDVKPGRAYIYSTVNGVSPEKYEIEIVKVDKFNRENKNFVVKISDEELISETGGIVQGMSGSPILQNGRLVGAITHVFLNDPTRGYGIDIERMLQE